MTNVRRFIHWLVGHTWEETGGAADDTYFGYRSRTKVFKCSCGKWKVEETIHDMLKQRSYTLTQLTDTDPTREFIG